VSVTATQSEKTPCVIVSDAFYQCRNESELEACVHKPEIKKQLDFMKDNEPGNYQFLRASFAYYRKLLSRGVIVKEVRDDALKNGECSQRTRPERVCDCYNRVKCNWEMPYSKKQGVLV